jgi:hypothetical protein
MHVVTHERLRSRLETHLAEDQQIGLDRIVVCAQALAGSTKTSLHFIRNQQNVVPTRPQALRDPCLWGEREDSLTFDKSAWP